MSEEGKDIFFNMAMVGIVLCSIIFLLSPSPIQICIKAGYEWRGGDCVMGVTHD
jgi:hypothetical protein